MRKAIGENKPPVKTFLQWIDKDENKSKQYARACEERAVFIFEDILDIADNTENEEIQKARLRVDARKWFLSKMLPKKYGDRLDLSSNDGSMTPQTNLITTLTPEQLKESLDK